MDKDRITRQPDPHAVRRRAAGDWEPPVQAPYVWPQRPAGAAAIRMARPPPIAGRRRRGPGRRNRRHPHRHPRTGAAGGTAVGAVDARPGGEHVAPPPMEGRRAAVTKAEAMRIARLARAELKNARVEDYTELRWWGLTQVQAAARIGVCVRTAQRYESELRR